MPVSLPDVSVVLPAFNTASTIERAARSILDQTLRNVELIVIDDGSTDETPAIVRRLREDDSRVRLLSREHRGVCAAANAAMEAAISPVIARMDADDFSYPHRLEEQLRVLHDSDLDVVGCQVRIIDVAGQPVGSLARYQRWINEETLDPEKISALRFVEFPLVNPTILARRKYFELGFRDQPDLPEDYDLMLRAAAGGMRFGKVAEVLFDWQDHSDRVTRTDSRYSAEAFMNCRRQHLSSGPLKGLSVVDLWGLGQTGKLWLRWLQSQGLTVRNGYDIDERKIGETIHGVPVSHPSQAADPDGTPLLIAVGSENARQIIRPQLLARGYSPGRDVWFVA